MAVDGHGITKLKADLTGGTLWEADWATTRSFTGIDPQDSWFDCNHGDASYTATAGELRISGAVPRMYVHNPADLVSTQWRDVEITCYFKRVADTSPDWAGMDAVARTRHSPDTNLCDTRGYAGRFRVDGHLDFEKEIRHNDSDTAADKVHWSGGMPFNTWIGYKYLVYDLPNGDVKLETYMDTTDGAGGGTWVKVNEYTDTGVGFGAGMTACAVGIDPEMKLTKATSRAGSESGKPNSTVYFRSDGVSTNGLIYKKASVREIDPTATIGGGGSATAYVGSGTASTATGAQTLTAPLPTGLTEGMLLIAVYDAATSQTGLIGPDGWTIQTIDEQIGTATARVAVAWTRYVSGMANPSFTLPAASTAKGSVAVVAYSADSEDPVFGPPAEITGTSAAVTGDVTVPNTRFVSIFAQRSSPASGVANVATAPTGQTERVNIAGTGGGSTGILIADEVVAAPAAGLTRTATYSVSASVYADLIAIAPVAASGSAPTIVGSTSAVTTTGVQTLSAPLSGIAGLQNGDMLIAGYVYADDPAQETIASRSAGWTPLVNDEQVSGQSAQVDLMWTTYTAGQTTNPSYTMSPLTTSAYNKAVVGVVAFRGAGAPVLGTPVERSALGTTTVAPSINAVVQSVVMAFFADKVSNQVTVTPPTGMATQVNRVVTGGGGCSLVMATETRDTAGPTGTRTATYDVASSIGYGVLLNIPAAGTLAPLVYAGADQSVAPGATVTLTGAATQGTLTGGSWVQTAGSPTVTLAGSGLTTRTFTAPSTANGTVLTFQYTGSNAAGSSSDTMTVTVGGTATGSATVVGSTVVQSGGTATLSVPLTAISGLQAGDLLVAGYIYGDDPTTGESIASRSTGWSALVNADQIGTNAAVVDIMQTIYAPGTTTNPSYTMTPPPTGTAYNKAILGVVAFRDAGIPAIGTPVERSTSTTSTVAPSIAATAGAQLLAFFGERVSSQTGAHAPAGMTARVEELNTGGGGVSLIMATEPRAAAGATGTRTATYDLASTIGYGVLLNIPYKAADPIQPPTVSAGASQGNIEPYTTVTLSGIISGTSTSSSWTQISGAPVTLVGTGQSRTFVAPGRVSGTTLVFQFTGSNGTASQSAQTTVTVLPVTERAVVDGQEVAMEIRGIGIG